MRAGASISAAVHGSALLFAIFGGFDEFSTEQPEPAVASVELISDVEFLALQSEVSGPEDSEEPAQPAGTPAAPASQEADSPETPAGQPPSRFPAQVPAVPVVADERDDGKTVTVPPAHADDREAVSISETESQPEDPARQSAERIAEKAAPEPETEVRQKEIEREAAAPEPQPAAPETVEQSAESAEERTVVENVTEADETEATALRVSRPMRRPARAASAVKDAAQFGVAEQERETEPVPAPGPSSEPAPEAPPDDPQPPEPKDPDIDIASLILQDLLAREKPGNSSDTVISQPLTASEREGLKRAIQNCWNIGSLSDAAKRITVTIGMELEPTGRPVPGSIKLLSASPGSDSARMRAYEAGQRAVMRCLNNGYDLPPDKYEAWRRVEIEFNPEAMRNR